VTNYKNMLATFETTAGATKSLGDMDVLLESLGDSGYPLSEVCRFIFARGGHHRRLKIVEAVGHFFDRLTHDDWVSLFEIARSQQINPYSFIFARPNGEPPARLPRPFAVLKDVYTALEYDPLGKAIPRLTLPWTVQSLPDNLIFPWGVEITGCRSLSRIGCGLQAGGPVTINHCRSLRGIPGRLRAHRGLRVEDAPSLRSLGSSIEVDGNLDLINLPMLAKHGNQIRVAGTLRIRNCPKLRTIRPSMSVSNVDIIF
jgi:hypothetical protein